MEKKVLFTLNEGDEIDYIVLNLLNFRELEPFDFDEDAIEEPLIGSEWMNVRGEFEVEFEVFIVKVLTEHAPEEFTCTPNYYPWQQNYIDYSEWTDDLKYNPQVDVKFSRIKTWRDEDNVLYAEYKLTDMKE